MICEMEINAFRCHYMVTPKALRDPQEHGVSPTFHIGAPQVLLRLSRTTPGLMLILRRKSRSIVLLSSRGVCRFIGDETDGAGRFSMTLTE